MLTGSVFVVVCTVTPSRFGLMTILVPFELVGEVFVGCTSVGEPLSSVAF